MPDLTSTPLQLRWEERGCRLSRLRLESEGSPGRTGLQSNLISAQHGAVIRLGPQPHPGFPGWRWLETGRWRMEEGSGLMLEIKMLPWGSASILLPLAAELAWQLEREVHLKN